MSKPTISNDTRYAPALAGVHHLKLPVSDLARSRQWYRTRLGYEVTMEFVEQGRLMGYVLEHPNGGPQLALRLAPVRARAAAGFDYFAIGVPGKTALDELAVRLTALGEDHDGVHFASIGWVLPHLYDPDGHEVRFYTIEQHTDPRAPGITTIEDPRETSERHEREWRAVGTAPGQRRSQLARCRHVVAAAAWGLRWGSFRVSRAGSCQGSAARAPSAAERFTSPTHGLHPGSTRRVSCRRRKGGHGRTQRGRPEGSRRCPRRDELFATSPSAGKDGDGRCQAAILEPRRILAGAAAAMPRPPIGVKHGIRAVHRVPHLRHRQGPPCQR